jgi:hypothetical protein
MEIDQFRDPAPFLRRLGTARVLAMMALFAFMGGDYGAKIRGLKLRFSRAVA